MDCKTCGRSVDFCDCEPDDDLCPYCDLPEDECECSLPIDPQEYIRAKLQRQRWEAEENKDRKETQAMED